MSKIHEESGTVKLVNGKATIRYLIRDPSPVTSNSVDCSVRIPMSLNSKTTIKSQDPSLPESYVVTAKTDAENIIYNITSSKPNSNRPTSFTITETSTDKPIETFTIRGTLLDQVITYAISSNDLTNEGMVSVTCVESVVNPTRMINTVVRKVRLIKGQGSLRYSLLDGQPEQPNVVVATLNDIALTSTTTPVPKYIPPVSTGPDQSPYIFVTINNSSGAPASGTVSGTVHWSGLSTTQNTGVQMQLSVSNARGNILNSKGIGNGIGQKTASGTYSFSAPYSAVGGGSKCVVGVYAGCGAQTYPNGASSNGANHTVSFETV